MFLSDTHIICYWYRWNIIWHCLLHTRKGNIMAYILFLLVFIYLLLAYLVVDIAINEIKEFFINS